MFSEPKIDGTCVYKKETYQRGVTFNDACEAVCSCEEGGFVTCKPRYNRANFLPLTISTFTTLCQQK